MNKRNLILRLIASPFILGILLILYTHQLLKHFVKYIRWGGEWITYSKDDTVRMKDIFDWIKENY